MRVLLGVSGSIAAYKTAELVRLIRRNGDRVQVVLTRAAREFVAPRALAALSDEPVLEDLFAPGAASIEHIAAAQAADVAVVAPATAHTLARIAAGLADDYLTTLLLATPAPLVVAPAMNVQMWRHPATQANLARLRERGVVVVPPAEGELACGMHGEGRMAEPDAIFAAVQSAVPAGAAPMEDLRGQRILVTAGPTREALDPVRFLSNRSSGKMGFALAQAARRRGAQVRLIAGPTALTAPAGVEVVHVTTAAQMAEAALAFFPACDFAIMAAAVADYRPKHISAEKLKKSGAGLHLELEPTPDILAELGRRKGRQVLIGFAAETDAARGLEYARAKLAAKRADLIVLNHVSDPEIGFDSDENAATLVGNGDERALARAPKPVIADLILDAALALAHAAPHPR
ncbi:MAG TPA: bifunctional phosphopantothenoylcysteine decarboxylase/phosphopantothenate--cysteine ligase CoaBC [Terriglobales bacterium]|nr:bifunctional phosphopantothenoylcysteine decarboxylase/phosphopantothenate--cysteine ligase CoaBC [Terriglobales bacterium]